ncbi:hypothetical protein BC833DRAFT_626411 [Globomyces pollinis-pini]|nr:hypothetical protein BC833DRAFT_626411 [Globomyces pollinis-pini]
MSQRYTYLHHPTCSKATTAAKLVDEQIPGLYKRIDYLDNPPTTEELTAILNLMDEQDLRLVVRTENLTSDEKNPVEKGLDVQSLVSLLQVDISRLQRPILVDHVLGKATVGRPMERLHVILALKGQSHF